MALSPHANLLDGMLQLRTTLLLTTTGAVVDMAYSRTVRMRLIADQKNFPN
jgi:hypothetical protein